MFENNNANKQGLKCNCRSSPANTWQPTPTPTPPRIKETIQYVLKLPKIFRFCGKHLDSFFSRSLLTVDESFVQHAGSLTHGKLNIPRATNVSHGGGGSSRPVVMRCGSWTTLWGQGRVNRCMHSYVEPRPLTMIARAGFYQSGFVRYIRVFGVKS